jgi:hypothetical protein
MLPSSVELESKDIGDNAAIRNQTPELAVNKPVPEALLQCMNLQVPSLGV